MTIWAVFTGQYEDHGLEETFVSEELAQQFIELLFNAFPDDFEGLDDDTTFTLTAYRNRLRVVAK